MIPVCWCRMSPLVNMAERIIVLSTMCFVFPLKAGIFPYVNVQLKATHLLCVDISTAEH